MQLCRTDGPCRQCPWRRTSTAGWLGGLPIEWFTSRARAQAEIACHMTVKYNGDPQARLCAGFAQHLNNACSSPRDPELAKEVTKAGQNPDVFRTTSEFDAHHRTEQYGRMMDELEPADDE